jgi:putative redox protein
MLDLPDGPPHAHALFAHCFTCTKESLAAVRIGRALAGQGIGVLRFDFTGLGQSGGDFADSTFSGSVRDLLAAARAMGEAGKEPALLIGHSLGGAAVLAAAADLPNVKAIATIGAPCDVQHVTRLFGDGLKTLLEQGEAEVKLGGRPFKMRRSFVDDLSAHAQRQRIASLRRALLVRMRRRIRRSTSTTRRRLRRQTEELRLAGRCGPPADAFCRLGVRRVISAWATRYLGKAPPRSASEPGQVVVEETGEGDFQVEVLAGEVRFLADEPVEVGGMGSGPTPYDLLCAALGACTALTVRMYARRKALPLRRVRVCVGHARTKGEDPPDGFLREVALEGDLTDKIVATVEIASAVRSCLAHAGSARRHAGGWNRSTGWRRGPASTCRMTAA